MAITLEDIMKDERFNEKQKEQLRLGLEAGLDVSVYASPDFTWPQMNILRRGLAEGLDVSEYAKPELTIEEMMDAKYSLKKRKEFSNKMDEMEQKMEADTQSLFDIKEDIELGTEEKEILEDIEEISQAVDKSEREYYEALATTEALQEKYEDELANCELPLEKVHELFGDTAQAQTAEPKKDMSMQEVIEIAEQAKKDMSGPSSLFSFSLENMNEKEKYLSVSHPFLFELYKMKEAMKLVKQNSALVKKNHEVFKKSVDTVKEIVKQDIPNGAKAVKKATFETAGRAATTFGTIAKDSYDIGKELLKDTAKYMYKAIKVVGKIAAYPTVVTGRILATAMLGLNVARKNLNKSFLEKQEKIQSSMVGTLNKQIQRLNTKKQALLDTDKDLHKLKTEMEKKLHTLTEITEFKEKPYTTSKEVSFALYQLEKMITKEDIDFYTTEIRQTIDQAKKELETTSKEIEELKKIHAKYQKGITSILMRRDIHKKEAVFQDMVKNLSESLSEQAKSNLDTFEQENGIENYWGDYEESLVQITEEIERTGAKISKVAEKISHKEQSLNVHAKKAYDLATKDIPNADVQLKNAKDDAKQVAKNIPSFNYSDIQDAFAGPDGVR